MVPLEVPTNIGGSEVSEIFIPEDTTIYVGMWAINTDPLIWGPDAKEWKPERFLNPLPESVTDAKVPGIYSNLSVSPLLVFKDGVLSNCGSVFPG